MRVAALERNLRALLGRALARHFQHLLRRVDGRDVGAAACHQQRCTAGPGGDIEDRPILNPSDHVREHARLRGRDELANRPAEAALLERTRHGGIGVR